MLELYDSTMLSVYYVAVTREVNKDHIAVLVVNYGISNTFVLEIP